MPAQERGMRAQERGMPAQEMEMAAQDTGMPAQKMGMAAQGAPGARAAPTNAEHPVPAPGELCWEGSPG